MSSLSARRRILHGSTVAVTILSASSGCSWFRRGDGATKPMADPAIYASPVRADPNRTGDYRTTGVLEEARDYQSVPVTPRVRAMPDRPLVLLPPTSRPVSSSEYVVLGSVVANVNGSPVYAHELIRHVAPLLRARAREVDEKSFRRLARDELIRQRRTLIEDELVYAAAQRNTNQEEAREAQARTYVYREQLISQAGGSLEMARTIARDAGDDFDRLLKKKERENLVGIYYRKRVSPRVALTVDEMRRHYEQNREREFTVAPQATIRLIRIDLKDVGSESAALGRIEEARRRAAGGESFEALSDAYNRLPLLVQQKGMVGPLSPGAYREAAVDAAIWTTPAGGVSDVVRTPTALYLVHVVERTEGRTMAFDEPEVQASIQAALRRGKMTELQARTRETLAKDAVIQADDALLEPVVEMAMQMYGGWHAGGR